MLGPKNAAELVGMVSNHLHTSCIQTMTLNILDFGQETWPSSTALVILMILLNYSVMLYHSLTLIWLESVDVVLVSMFGESEDISCPAYCCDVCEMEVATLHERKVELSLLIQLKQSTS